MLLNFINHHWHWIVLAGMAVIVIFIPIPANASAPTQRTFHLDARRFEYSPAILHVNPGDQVTIELTAEDVMHGLSIDGYDVETRAGPGKTSSITFIADKSGSFRFHCTVICGNMHPFMAGRLEVGRNTLLIRAAALMGLALMAGVWMVRK